MAPNDVSPSIEPAAADAGSGIPAGSPGGGDLPALPAPGRGSWSLPLLGILALMLLYTLYFARDVLVPIAVAVTLNLLLSPLVRKLGRWRIPAPLGAALVMAAMLAGVGWAVYGLSGPAAEWMRKAPDSLVQVERKLRDIKEPVQEVTRATRQVEKLAQMGPPGAAAPTVELRERSLAQIILSGTTLLGAQVAVVVVLLFFLLASGDTFMRRLVKAMTTGRDKRRVVEIVRAVQHDVTVYLGTVTMINCGLGAATAMGMALVGMPNPVLWGALAATLNFVPYVGALTTTVILAVVGLLSFDHLGHGLLGAGIFQILANIESNLVTPWLLGRRLTLNPALVFAAVVLWSWMWGIPGALLAVPFLVTAKIFTDHLEALAGVGIFLGRGE